MINTKISFDKAVETVEHYTSTDKKGNSKLSKAQVGFTSYANAIKTLTQYRDLGKFTVPSKVDIAEELLKKVEEIYK
ncbi:hypothetical protein NVP1161O_197 [Vibrio phage 1.161.O._10N.261.48.C5]|nr:hypothetical protein NVP1161O_197 [Vibrio phage 1.161.O._10N.261.48.C5]